MLCAPRCAPAPSRPTNTGSALLALPLPLRRWQWFQMIQESRLGHKVVVE